MGKAAARITGRRPPKHRRGCCSENAEGGREVGASGLEGVGALGDGGSVRQREESERKG